MNTEETKKCPDCLADIPKKAKKCSHCGKKQKQKLTKNQTIGLVIVCIIFFSWLFSGNETKPNIVTETGVTDSQAYIISQNFIKEILKSPGTADFPFGEYAHIKNDEDTHTVTSYVDSENGFGANVRNNWTVTLTYNGGDWASQNNWTLDRLIFDGEAVYVSDNFENAISTIDEELTE